MENKELTLDTLPEQYQEVGNLYEEITSFLRYLNDCLGFEMTAEGISEEGAKAIVESHVNGYKKFLELYRKLSDMVLAMDHSNGKVMAFLKNLNDELTQEADSYTQKLLQTGIIRLNN